jgi:ribokinase
MKPIVVIGSINMDLVTQVERIPRPGETLTGTGFQTHSGGKGANQAVAVARLGYPCVLLGAVGEDVFGRELLQALQAYGVDVSHVRTVPGPTGTASIAVSASAENSIIVTPGANAHVTTDYISGKADLIRNAGMVLLQLEIPIETIESVTRFCAEHGVPVMLDPAPARALTPTILKHVHWFTPNQIEAEFYSGGSGKTEDILAKFFAAEIRNVILKRGAEGALIATTNGQRCRVAAFEVPARDTTAAGDAYNGAFAVALLRGKPIAECARFAAAAAAISVTRPGAQPSLATGDEVSAFFEDIASSPVSSD